MIREGDPTALTLSQAAILMEQAPNEKDVCIDNSIIMHIICMLLQCIRIHQKGMNALLSNAKQL